MTTRSNNKINGQTGEELCLMQTDVKYTFSAAVENFHLAEIIMVYDYCSWLMIRKEIKAKQH